MDTEYTDLLLQECQTDSRFLSVILEPILNTLCYNTTGHDVFAFELRCSGIIKQNQEEECNHKTTSLEKSKFLYNIIMKKPIGYNNLKNLTEALNLSGNTDMIRRIVQSYKEARGGVLNSGYTSDTPLLPSSQNVTVTDSTSSPNDSLPPSLQVVNEILNQMLDSNQTDQSQMQTSSGSDEANQISKMYGVTLSDILIIDEKTKANTTGLELLRNCQFSVKNLCKYLAQLASTLETLEFDKFTIISDKKISVKSLISPHQSVLFPELKSLTINIDSLYILTSKKLLKSLVSVFNWEGSPKSRLNKLWNLSKSINIVDIRIDGKKFLFFSKAEGHLKVNRLPYFDPNKYLPHFDGKLRKFCCAENYRKLCLEKINPTNLTELNLNKCKFSFPPTDYELELSSFLSKGKNLTKIVIDCQKYTNTDSDCGDLPNFNLNYIETASKLKVLKLGNFKIILNTDFRNIIWNGQTLVFYNCDLDSLNLEELKVERDILEKSSPNNDNIKTFVQIQNNGVIDEVSGSQENTDNNDEENDSWVKIQTNDNKWSLCYRVYSGTPDNFKKTYFEVFELSEFSDFENHHI